MPMDAGCYVTYLRNLAVSVSIGIHGFERDARQTLLVSVALFQCEPEGADDEIAAVQDYDFVRDGVRALVATRHFNLQETLCREILRLCLSEARILGAVVRTEKSTVYPDADGVGCKMALFRDLTLGQAPWWLLPL